MLKLELSVSPDPATKAYTQLEPSASVSERLPTVALIALFSSIEVADIEISVGAD